MYQLIRREYAKSESSGYLENKKGPVCNGALCFILKFLIRAGI